MEAHSVASDARVIAAKPQTKKGQEALEVSLSQNAV